MRSEIILPGYMVEVRRHYPGAISIGRAQGMESQLPTELTRRERRGEIVALRQYAKKVRPGVIEIPYVRMKSVKRMRWERALRIAPAVLASVLVVGGVGYMIWSIRYLLLSALGVLAAVMLLWLASHWKNGCPGIHCAGCGG